MATGRHEGEMMAAAGMETRVRELEESLSKRIARLEEQMAQIARQVAAAPASSGTAWWKKIVGVYKNDPEFDEAMRLGREYRESLRPREEEAAEDIP